MPRRYSRRSSKGDARIFLLLAALAIFIILLKVILILFVGFAVGFALRQYYRWYFKRLPFYNNDRRAFWRNELKAILLSILATFFVLAGVGLSFSRLGSGVILSGIGLVMYPAIQKRIAGYMAKRFKYHGGITIGVLIVLLFIVDQSYNPRQNAVTNQEVESRKQDAEQKEQQLAAIREGNARSCTNSALEFLHRKKYKHALALIDSSLLLSPDNDTARYTKAVIHNELKQYDQAIVVLNNIPSLSAEARLLRAKCLVKTGQAQNAVSDLKIVAATGDREGAKLYNKVNPIIRKITGYVTRCCDGSISYSSGRGTCSHHGGVCDWNEPVYEEYRKYGD